MTSHLVFVGNGKDGTISSFGLTAQTLEPLAVSEVGARGLPLAVDPARGLVFAGTSDPFGVAVLRLDQGSGALTKIGWQQAVAAPVYLRLGPGGEKLFWASYHQGLGGVWQVSGEATLRAVGEPIAWPNLHSVQVSADGRFAYFVSLRDDLVAQYAVDEAGRLRPLAVPTVAAPAGSGPRHIIISASGESVYVITEYSGEVLHYGRDLASGMLEFAGAAVCMPTDGGLRPSRFGADPRAEGLIWGSDLHLDASGRRLYCAERNRATITALDIGADGALGEATAHSEVVAQPRAFAVLPGGDLLVASETDRVVARYRPDASGALGSPQIYAAGLGANWIEVIACDGP